MVFQMKRWLLPIVLFLSSSVHANNFSYDYFEFRVGGSPASLGAEYSFSLTDNFHAIAHLDSQFEYDGNLGAGIGFNGPINDFIDIYGQAVGHYVDYPDKTFDDSEALLELNMGIRLWIAENIETEVRVGTIDEHSIFDVGVRFHASEQLSVGAGFVNNGIWGPQVELNVRAIF